MLPENDSDWESVRASRAGHTFHERWAARRALQLIFPDDALFAIAVEGISSTETAKPGSKAEEVADLVHYYGSGDNFASCDRLETVQFKYKLRSEPVTASYLKKTIEKFAATIVGYEGNFSVDEIDRKLSFLFVTNTEFKPSLWEAIKSLLDGSVPKGSDAATQLRNLKKWCANSKLQDSSRLFKRIVFKAGEESITYLDNALKRTLTDWSSGADAVASGRLLGLQHLVQDKAGPSGQGKNLIHREDVLNALDCELEDLFPAKTQFLDVGKVIDRAELTTVNELIQLNERPIFVHADGGAGKTVFVTTLATFMENEFEVVVYDCFGGGSYRFEHDSRHLPRIGLVQIINELALRTLCDPLLPDGDDSRKILRATRKRLSQASLAIQTQSKKKGLLIIVDAADNAQLEADHRHEEAFPRMLLASLGEDPINGVRLVYTARTHRKNKIIGHTLVHEVKLGPFTVEEALEFLQIRKPDASDEELAKALARSGRNARVLNYLIQTWDKNISNEATDELITAPEIIAQSCENIIRQLRIAGWDESEVVELFVAISFLPPPIPLEELANALNWATGQVNTAISDLAPMIEMTFQGVIFRDEPTETYIRETYSHKHEAEKSIADRLLASQATSAYSAEALPHFLVIINDSDRAFALADSTDFPSTVESDFGRRRLTLVRLRGAFKLAVAASDFDRVLNLSMRLAQVTMANMRGDEFIRSSPALAIVLGDTESYRRLFSDRSGWRGARSARLSVAHLLSGDEDEALVQSQITKRWISWYNTQSQEEFEHHQQGPTEEDFAAVLFYSLVTENFVLVDSNLARWKGKFSLDVGEEILNLIELYDVANGTNILSKFISFVCSEECISQSLKLILLSRPKFINKKQLRTLSISLKEITSAEDYAVKGNPNDIGSRGNGDIVQAALSALIHNSRTSAAAIIQHAPITRLSSYDFRDSYSTSTRIWPLVLRACIHAWSSGRHLAFYDLLPQEVKISRKAKSITTKTGLIAFLSELTIDPTANRTQLNSKKKSQRKFNDQEIEAISESIKLCKKLISPIEKSIFSGNKINTACVTDFLTEWESLLGQVTKWHVELVSNEVIRYVGLGVLRLIINHAEEITVNQAKIIVRLLYEGAYNVRQKMDVLRNLVRSPELHEISSVFAQEIEQQIRKDENIGQRGDMYAELASSLVCMSLGEAKEYYMQGLAQLDQMGGESFEQIYSLLDFASQQQGGLVSESSGQRLMNLCETLINYDAGKFAWTMFARATANSVGFPALAKLIRWHDQDIADISYGMPQMVCFLAEKDLIDPRRAALILTICGDRGWYEWRTGDGVKNLLQKSSEQYQRKIFFAVLKKLLDENPSGGWPSLWESLIDVGSEFPNALSKDDTLMLLQLKEESRKKQDEYNSLNSSYSREILNDHEHHLNQIDLDNLLESIVGNCNHTSAASLDQTLLMIQSNDRLRYSSRSLALHKLRASCSFANRLDYLFALCEANELNFSQSLDELVECYNSWISSSKHLVSKSKEIVSLLFECKGSELLVGSYSTIARDTQKLTELCNDPHYVFKLVLTKVAAEEVELDSDEWLQLATSLCKVASPNVGLEALEKLLTGPASRFADEIGEGSFRAEFTVNESEIELFTDIIWHLLGDDDSFIRWKVARGLNTLADLELMEDINVLLKGFDKTEIRYLKSENKKLAFQNSQQWLLMGLSRAAFNHGQLLSTLQPSLAKLLQRPDQHVINKLHIARSLSRICADSEIDNELQILINEVSNPPCGKVKKDSYANFSKPKTEFGFDYEFTKYELSTFANLFNISQGEAQDKIAKEIMLLWPDAASMDYFPGKQRYHADRGDRYETYREHIQRHALLKAVTSLSKHLPVVVREYDSTDYDPWMEWCDEYDTTFDDGSWLSDWKDAVPLQAKVNLLGKRQGSQEKLHNQDTLFEKLGILDFIENGKLPIYANWLSPDGVTVSVSSALTDRKGAIGRCQKFSKLPLHDNWLPEFWDAGYYETSHRSSNVFEPFIWSPEYYRIGIDSREEIASRSVAERPRLGIDLTNQLKLSSTQDNRQWVTKDEKLALVSQVWGSWKRDHESRSGLYQDEGKILWAANEWLMSIQDALNKAVVLRISLRKYRSYRPYDDSSDIEELFIGLIMSNGTLRFWPAKNSKKR